MAEWLPTEVVRTLNKGTTSDTSLDDTTTSEGTRVETHNTTDGVDITTTTVEPERTTTTVKGGGTETRSENKAASTTQTVREDAGGTISFSIKINGGLLNGSPNPVCP